MEVVGVKILGDYLKQVGNIPYFNSRVFMIYYNRLQCIAKRKVLVNLTTVIIRH